MKFTLTIPKEEVAKAYNHVLEESVKNAQIEGFRIGKAPKKLVEEKLGKQKLLESTLNHILPQAYAKEVKTKKLRPITSPQITPKGVEMGQNWVFEIEIAEPPQVDLGEYQNAVKAANAKGKIWVPGKDDPKKESQKNDDKKLKAIFDSLLKTAKLKVPKLLIKEEVNRMLSKLVNQISKLGLSVEQYVSSMNTTNEKLRENYQKTATESLKLEFILIEVSKDLKIEITDKEIDDMIASVKDEKTKQQLNIPRERAAIKAMLSKRKTVDQLLKM